MPNRREDGVEERPVRLARHTIYESPWVSLYRDRVRFPQGRIIDEHHVLEFEREAVAAVVENEQGEVLMVEAYRYVTNSIEWEVPAGGIDAGESPLEAAEREVREESGYASRDHKLLMSYYPSNGISNQRFHTVHCFAGEGSGDFDRNEIRSVCWKSRDEVRRLLLEDTLNDGLTITALLYWLLEKGTSD